VKKIHISIRRTVAIPAIVSVGALVFVAMHLMWPKMKIDSVILGLLVIAILPWLGSVFESVEGAGWKVTYRRMRAELDITRDELEITKGEVESTRNRTDFIESTGVRDLRPGTPDDELRQLIQRYDGIRENMKSGLPRTKEMTDVVRHLTILAQKLDGIDWSTYLSSGDAGKRLAAYSYYYVRPRPSTATDIVRSLTSVENTPFGQYWAIRALSSIIDVSPSSLHRFLPALNNFLPEIPAGSDRYYELSQLIDAIRLGRQSTEHCAVILCNEPTSTTDREGWRMHSSRT
jgi:hypothetical protein